MPERTSYLPGEPSWVEVTTTDLEASIAFYSALLGWQMQRGGAEMGHYTVALKDGRAVCGLTPMAQEGQPVAWTAYLNVEDADATAELVTAHGGTTYLPPMDVMDLGRMAVFGDPTGAAIAVWQPRGMLGAGLTQEEGALSWTELSSRDLKAAIPFYRSVFGWAPMDEGGYTHFQIGDASVAGAMDMPEAVPAQVPSFWMPYFGSADPRAQAERAAELGGSVMVPYMKVSTVEFSVVADPFGAAFGLMKEL